MGKQKGAIVCGMGECDKATCCAAMVTTVTTTPQPEMTTTPSDPCAPSLVGRKYDDKRSALAFEAAASKRESGVPAWSFSLLGAASLATLSFAVGFIAVRARQRSIRWEPVLQSEEFDEEAYILSKDGL